MRERMETFRRLVEVGNKFRNTPIVDDGFSAIRDEFDALLDKATKLFKTDDRCPCSIDGDGLRIEKPAAKGYQEGRCYLKAGHRGSCCNLRSIWTIKENRHHEEA